MNTVGPTIASLPTYIQSPRNIVVPSIDVIFSEPIDPSTFTYPVVSWKNSTESEQTYRIESGVSWAEPARW